MSKKSKDNIEKRVHPTGKVTYRARVRIKGYAPQQATFTTIGAAKHWQKRVESDLRDHKYFPTKKAQTTSVADVIDLYLAWLKGDNPRRHDEVLRMLKWWKKELGHTMLTHLTSEQIHKGQLKLLVRKRERKLADGSEVTLNPATVNRYTVAIKTALKYAVKQLKWITINPAADIELLTESKGRVRCLSSDELNKLLAACKQSKNPYLFAIVILGLATGARRSEIRYLKWTDVDDGCSRVTFLDTKNGESRSAPLTGVAAKVVQLLRDKRKNSAYLFPSPLDGARPIDFESAWRQARKVSKVEDFRFHDNRHTFASYLAMNGASLLEMAEAMGHKDLSMVVRYAHITKGHTSEVVAKMTGKVLGHVEV